MRFEKPKIKVLCSCEIGRTPGESMGGWPEKQRERREGGQDELPEEKLCRPRKMRL